jgi:hypothetical protein
MSKQRSDTHLRIEELLIEQAINGLSDLQQAELDALDSTANRENPYMETAALIQLGLAAIDQSARGTSAMPANLRNRLQQAAIKPTN